MRVTGLLETALYVADPAAAAAFYRRLFGFEPLLETDRLHALNVAGRDVLLLFRSGVTEEPAAVSGGIIPGHGATGRTHFAFSIPADDYAAWEERLGEQSIAIEGTVNWPGGSRSLYFRDPDRHLVELITPGFWAIY